MGRSHKLIACPSAHFIQAPTEAERSSIISHCMDDFKLASDVSAAHLSIQTAALVATDIVDFLTQAEVIAVRESLYGQSLSG